jgi:hypothetical protein
MAVGTKTYVYTRQDTLLESILADLFSIGMLMIFFWINYKFIGDNHFIIGLITVLFIGYCHEYWSIRRITYDNKQKLIDDLQNDKI